MEFFGFNSILKRFRTIDGIWVETGNDFHHFYAEIRRI